MLETRSFIRLFDTGYILRLFLLIMLFSLLPFADMWGLLYLDIFIPRHILLAGVISTALIGLAVTFFLINRLIATMLGRIRDGYYPGANFFHLVGLFLAGIFLLTPGFIGDALGVLLLVPAIRGGVGRLIAGKMENRFKEMYEYLKLYEQ